MKYYKFMSDEMGLTGQIQLAQLTKVPSAQAAMVPDDPDTLELFRKAVIQITGKAAPF